MTDNKLYLYSLFKEMSEIDFNLTPSMVFRKKLCLSLEKDLAGVVSNPAKTARKIASRMDVNMSAFGTQILEEDRTFVKKLARVVGKAIANVATTMVPEFGTKNFVATACKMSVYMT